MATAEVALVVWIILLALLAEIWRGPEILASVQRAATAPSVQEQVWPLSLFYQSCQIFRAVSPSCRS